MKESKDNALMTPLMNTAANNHPESFVYMYFKENCDLKNTDLQVSTLLHLAAKSNSINIVRLLSHIYAEQTHEDSNLELASQESIGDNLIFFDMEKVNSNGHTPIFQTVNTRSADVMKYLMSNGCNIAQKDVKGDTVKDDILRYMFKDTKFVNLYVKYENRILINRIYETHSTSFG